MVELKGLRAEATCDGNETGGDLELPPQLLRSAPRHEVACELLTDKAIVGLVAVEGVDDVVAVTVHFRDRAVSVVSRSVGVAREVEPVASPSLAMARRCKEPLDEARIGVRRGIFDEGLNRLGRRRQSHKIEVDAADESVPVGIACGAKSLLLALRDQEAIDEIRRPVVYPTWRRHVPYGLKGPVLARDVWRTGAERRARRDEKPDGQPRPDVPP